MSAELVRSRSRVEVVPADFGQSVLVFVLIVRTLDSSIPVQA
jgi:hypothetical protein